MPRTIIDPSAVSEAKAIISRVCDLMSVSEQDIISGRRNRNTSYVRRLIIYCIRSRTMLQWRTTGMLVGLEENRGMTAMTNFRRVRRAYKSDEDVKADINQINHFLNS